MIINIIGLQGNAVNRQRVQGKQSNCIIELWLDSKLYRKQHLEVQLTQNEL